MGYRQINLKMWFNTKAHEFFLKLSLNSHFFNEVIMITLSFPNVFLAKY